jgi:hypothetical protein
MPGSSKHVEMMLVVNRDLDMQGGDEANQERNQNKLDRYTDFFNEELTADEREAIAFISHAEIRKAQDARDATVHAKAIQKTNNAVSNINVYLRNRAIESGGRGSIYKHLDDLSSKDQFKRAKKNRPWYAAFNKDRDYFARQASWQRILDAILKTLQDNPKDGDELKASHDLIALQEYINRQALYFKGWSGQNRFHKKLTTLANSIVTMEDLRATEKEYRCFKKSARIFEAMDRINDAAKAYYRQPDKLSKSKFGLFKFKGTKESEDKVREAQKTYQEVYDRLGRITPDFLKPKVARLVIGENTWQERGHETHTKAKLQQQGQEKRRSSADTGPHPSRRRRAFSNKKRSSRDTLSPDPGSPGFKRNSRQ